MSEIKIGATKWKFQNLSGYELTSFDGINVINIKLEKYRTVFFIKRFSVLFIWVMHVLSTNITSNYVKLNFQG